METYTLLRAFADSWFLLFMFAFFVGTAIWLCFPARRKGAEEAAKIPFRDEAKGCDKSCETCACKDVSKGLIHG